MALRRFRGATTNSTVVFTGQVFNRELLDTGSATGVNGSTVTLAAGASASGYITSATGIPNLTTAVTGSWEASIQFQTVTPTSIFCKFRVHRISVAGTVPTILASTEYSAEVEARATLTPYIISTDGTNLGTFSSGDRIAIEWTLRNAGATSLSPAPSFGTYGRFVRTPIESTAAVGWTGFVGQAAYRPISYSEGTIKGVKRTGSVRNSITSSGTATGTKGGSAFSGSVTGVSTSTGTVTGNAGFRGSVAGISTSSGTIAAGRQGYTGTSTGASTSSGTIAAGRQGYTGSITGSSTSSGTVAAGRQGYSGASTGSSTSTGVIAAGRQGYAGAIAGISTSTGAIASGVQGYSGAATGASTSTGTAHGTPSPQPEPESSGVGSVWRAWNSDFAQERPKVLDISARSIYRTTYSFGMASGAAGFSGTVLGESVENGSSAGQLGYYGGVTSVRHLVRHRLHGKARHDLRGNRELLVLIGEL